MGSMAITTASADLSAIRHEQLRNWIQEEKLPQEMGVEFEKLKGGVK
jgi:hypothetical protein